MIQFLVGFVLGSLCSWFMFCSLNNSAESESDKKRRAWRKRCHDYYTGRRYSVID